jgi:eukaryotic-like serine/threonine-protein kinase
VALLQGARLGPYEILGLLGAGGMGEVYRARDTRLGRDVAVKVLPTEYAQSPDRLRRFEQEARLAGSLSHPNVLSLYDVGTHEGAPYLVTELLEGRSLRDVLDRGPLGVRKAVECAQQIARGLAAAHAKGIVHRDLKPENLFVTRDGQVKILDFGLAKLTEHDSSAVGQTNSTTTTEGHVLGTVGYMSPEQVRGRPADARSDIFALGTVLYELLSGRRAFSGDSAADTMTAILMKDPEELGSVGLSVPPGLERMLRRCLEKDPEQRFQTAHDLALALEAESGAGQNALVDTPIASRHWRRVAAVTALVVLGSLATAVSVLWRRPPAVPRVRAIRQVTHDGKLKEAPVHTDGTRVYYTAYSANNVSSRLAQVPVTGGDSAPLETPFRRPYLQDILPSRNQLLVEDDVRWAPDPVWLVSTTGASLRPLGDIEAFDSAWSADGQRIVYANGNSLFLARSDGSGSRRLLTAPAGVFFPRLSPDGQRLRYTVQGESPSLWEAAGDGGGPHALLPGWNAAYGRWTPDGRYYVFAADRDGEAALWALREKGRWPWSPRTPSEPSKLTTAPMRYFMPTISPDGRTVFALGQPPSTGGELVRYETTSGLFVPFLGGPSDREVEFSRDGRWIAYVRHPDGTLWRSRPDGTERRQLTFPPLTAMLPRWSPDGRRIAYMSFRPLKKWSSHIVTAEGGKPQPLTDQPGASDPTWSPDGTKLTLGGLAADHTTEHPILVQVVDLHTGRVSAVPGSEGLYSPRWSPDGRSIAALSANNTRLALFEFATGRWRDLVVGTEMLGHPTWTRDSTRIQLLKGGSIARVRVADGHVECVASLERVPLVNTSFSWSWIGIAPDDSPLALREMTGPTEIYALDVEWP